jgi:RimJ/RimL family protein N-acetyltransferase
MRSYKVLSKQSFVEGDYSLIPLRNEDRYQIMDWRNEQIFHLRQSELLTKEKQDFYFTNVIDKLFDQDFPKQILFSFLKDNECIGYGGLVHINWKDMNAEVSLVLNAEFNNHFFIETWTKYLSLLKTIAFKDLNLYKIFTYAFDIRPKLYKALENSGFTEESRLKEHCNINGKFLDVVYHSCFNQHHVSLREATHLDSELLFEWTNDIAVRQSSFNSNSINLNDHLSWFDKKLKSSETKIYIATIKQNEPIGQIRIDAFEDYWLIGYSIDKSFRGMGFGKHIVKLMIKLNPKKKFLAKVKSVNIASQKVFETLDFNKIDSSKDIITYNANT